MDSLYESMYIQEYGIKCYMLKESSSNKDVEDIVSTMNKKDLESMALYDSKYNSDNLIHRELKKIGSVPVAFFDISDEKGYMNVSVGTRSDDKFRGKGYANECVRKGVNWWKKNKHKYDNKKLSWWALENNTASIKLAENNGFKLDKESSSKYPGWCHYEL